MKKTKKILSFILSVAMICTMFTAFGVSVSAAGTKWVSGSGTQASPYLITNAAELEYLAETVNAGEKYAGVYFKLTNNIDLSTYSNWIPIGYTDEGIYFSGIFDGGNYTVSNMTTTGKDGENYRMSGLFGCVLNGTVKNLKIDNANVTAIGTKDFSFAGGLTGLAYLSNVENCFVYNSTINTNATDRSNNYAGGVIGFIASSNISSCGAVDCSVNSTATSGGFTATVEDTYENVDSSISKCFVMNSNVSSISAKDGAFSMCSGFIGDLCPDNDGGLSIENCFIYNVDIKDYKDEPGNVINALTGAFLAGSSGGVVTINNCYVDATITAKYAGSIKDPFSGETNLIKKTNCYYNSDKLTSSTTVTGVTAKTTTEINSQALADLLGTAFTYKNGKVVLAGIELPYMPDNRTTPVTANAKIPAPTYTVTIPATVDFGNQTQALEKYRGEANDQFGKAVLVSKDFVVSAKGVANLFDDLADGKADYINVTASFDSTLKGTSSTSNTVPYTINQNSTAIATGDIIATFYNDVDLASKGKTNSAKATITMNRADIKNADSYTGTMTFTIAVADR